MCTKIVFGQSQKAPENPLIRLIGLLEWKYSSPFHTLGVVYDFCLGTVFSTSQFTPNFSYLSMPLILAGCSFQRNVLFFSRCTETHPDSASSSSSRASAVVKCAWNIRYEKLRPDKNANVPRLAQIALASDTYGRLISEMVNKQPIKPQQDIKHTAENQSCF